MTNRRVLVNLSLFVLSGICCLAQPNPGPEGDHHPPSSFDSSPEATLALASVASPTKVLTSLTSSTNINYVAGPLDGRVWNLEARVKEVREYWRTSDKLSEASREAVRREALRYGRALEKIPQRELGLGGLIVKSEYACFAFVIAAANATSKGAQLSLAAKAEGHCRDASFHLQKATEQSSTDQNAVAVMRWASKSEEQPRISYLLAMSECLEAIASGSGPLKEESKKIVTTGIPAYYLDRYPPSQDLVLSRCTAR